jgi:hypothetical protein
MSWVGRPFTQPNVSASNSRDGKVIGSVESVQLVRCSVNVRKAGRCDIKATKLAYVQVAKVLNSSRVISRGYTRLLHVLYKPRRHTWGPYIKGIFEYYHLPRVDPTPSPLHFAPSNSFIPQKLTPMLVAPKWPLLWCPVPNSTMTSHRSSPKTTACPSVSRPPDVLDQSPT